MTQTILLCAGGTGGHLFPAEALAHELKSRGYAVHLATDERGGRYAGAFPADEVHVVPSATFGSKNPVAILKAGLKLWRGYRGAIALMKRLRPAVVIGFGGYPTVPPMMAAVQVGLPTMIHEQNAVMGRANKFLAPRVRAIAAGIPQDHADAAIKAKMTVTGNPVRPPVLEAASIPYAASQDDEPFRLVVFGGSQGAQFFSKALPAAIALMSPALRARLRVTQQARPEDEADVRTAYAAAGIPAEVSPFFSDMAARIGAAHLVVSRSGASTVSEICVIGRPSVLVPYPHALDHDQAANAARLEGEGGTVVAPQRELPASRLAELIRRVAEEPTYAEGMAKAAKSVGIPDAARLLADLVASIAGPGNRP
ncbi:undecaprenyldiphospho-muramoylpentapeptide beta-N-acetylglucosaminyltransferase [Aureimonas pseudogalii]|uniref:UDP-N-acetylglucosamine--N-acetylmuramyl-(pentapeptide) pyrophosphoryl-undecaprenol N-acetylglucosamine transferase n=1 Tax=Aureimonas pseudogalii TaxID=1744844 RepID=A0A7W6H678_9HYPH|nr:undecaprenyldiphospho-muramoylpentapeptide beta-N-acetylglucosaminyltransferase [Aureimonas pseudogalii]MBB3999332.1 UDP-N-acetylglucosamine--N-acetylmuramyl-(pentapeptide) pyrophosphoryl-undecaprenol N-acetylglucosamine transferase [Aureimonas pseudogalii]